MSRDWSNSLCSCFSDCTTCVVSFIAPCYYFGKNAEAVGENCLLCGLLYCLYPINVFVMPHIRGKIREQKGIEGSFVSDCLITNFCCYCAISQETRELNAPGDQAMARE